jgi:type I restriction enzyme S subunit
LTSNGSDLSAKTSKSIEDLDQETQSIAKKFYQNSPTDWGFEKLDNIILNFIDYRGKTPPKSDNGIRMLSAANVKNGFILPGRKEKFVTEETYDEWTTERRGYPQKGDVVITTEAPVGEVGLIRTEETFLTAQRLITLRTGDLLDSRYLKFCLQYERTQGQLDSYASGTTVSSFNQTDLRNTVIPLPSLNEQQIIGSILDNIERKISLNDKIIGNLEKMSKRVYQEWFVDFEPYKKFEDSDIGKIPEEFEVKNLTDIAEVTYGYAFSSDEFNEAGDGEPIIRIRNLPDDETDQYSPEEFKDKYRVEAGDVLAGMDGEFRPYIWKGPIAGLNQRVCKFEGESRYSSIYLWNAIRKPLYKLEQAKTGTTVIHLGKSDIDEIEIPVPDEESLNEFNEVMGPVYRDMIRRERENRQLENLRDSLLPKLMSGEIRVNDIELDELEVDSEV